MVLKIKIRKLKIAICFILVCVPGWAQKNVYFSFTPGAVVALPAPLAISQSGSEKISLWANYRTEPFRLPVYYSLWIGFGTSHCRWEAEMNHLKIFLKNKPPEVGQFSISHGYNQVFFSRAVTKKRVGVKFGAGFVLAHPENTIRGSTLDGHHGLFSLGYYFAGPAFQYGFYKEIDLGKWCFLHLESKISLAYADVPVAGGRAFAPVAAIHLQAGPGMRIALKRGTL